MRGVSVRDSKKVILTILDGWGMSCSTEGNAIAGANTPNFTGLWEAYPSTCLRASGEAVGLPEGQMGNSEVGHLNIGAGRVVYQEFTRISKAIREGEFFENQVLVKAFRTAREKGKSLHLMGLLSDGGVHSHIEHLFALLDMARQFELPNVYVHAFLDGRDVPPDNAREYIEQLEDRMQELKVGKIATVMGRYYAMDRDNRWERIEKAYTAMVGGEGLMAATASAAVTQSYEEKVTDEFVRPTVVVDEAGNPTAVVEPEDVIIFYNFRADRARQLTRAFVEKNFDKFERVKGYLNPFFVCMTQYHKDIPAPIAFPPQNLVHTLGEILAHHNLKQLRIAETEKYAHVTFFFNGGVEEPNPGEDRILVPSPKVATYNLQPEMSAPEVTEKVLEAIANDAYDVIILNFANPDMVGHTGIYEAAVKAVETVDECVGRIAGAVREKGGVMIITADHGNAEVMVEKDGGAHTAHTTDEVPFILVNDGLKNCELREGGALEDIAPTILSVLDIPKPDEMTGKSLIKEE
ncbi:MAG TPA: 2,3-bisphosphoglycerate-independent phosphoglycerate mutase [Clostridia bacterium]|jgi:2,3-bisphosphoglycerate-independent phosphoglycerate mutase|nr:2,3-bisphosphoglycerate-independent phosphoglycerate mutase [Clostridia bacterium]